MLRACVAGFRIGCRVCPGGARLLEPAADAFGPGRTHGTHPSVLTVKALFTNAVGRDRAQPWTQRVCGTRKPQAISAIRVFGALFARAVDGGKVSVVPRLAPTLPDRRASHGAVTQGIRRAASARGCPHTGILAPWTLKALGP